MSEFFALLKMIRLFVQTILFVLGVIKKEQYIKQIEDIDEWAKKAGDGKLEDRLQGGAGVEDNYNKHT